MTLHYGEIIRLAVRRKWHTPEQKEWWYTKLTAVRRAKTRRLSEAQNHRCATCGTLTWLSEQDRLPDQQRWQFATLEHVKPQSAGGSDHFHNTVMTCSRCNCRRGTMDIMKFWKLMQDPETAARFMRTSADVRRAAAERKAIRKAEKHPDKMERAAFRLAWAAFCSPAFSDYLNRYIDQLEQPLAA